MEEQEGNLKGKITKMQDVIDTCDQKAEAGTLGTSPVKEDCFKVIDALNLVVTDVLRNNSVSIENILYGK